MPYLGLGDHVGVKRQDHLAAVQRDVVEVGQRHLAARSIAAAPIPHAEQADYAQASTRTRVGLPAAFGEPQRHRRVTQLVTHAWRHVEPIVLLYGRLVFDQLPRVGNPWVVGAVLVPPALTV